MNLLNYLPEILLGQIPEAIYFALFMIYTKRLKEHRFKFIILMIIEYTLIMETLRFNIYAYLFVFIMTYLLLKVLYKEKSQIIDIFTFGIASIILMIISIVSYLVIWKTVEIYMITVILSRILMFSFILVFKDKLYKIQDLYKKLWNRNDKIKKKMKSATFRALNVVTFNFMFFIINCCLVFILMNGGV